TRARVRDAGGVAVKSTGDGFLATFDGPAAAIRCAEAIRAGLTPDGIRIRAGLHTGEIERMGDDIGGLAVHLAARVCVRRARRRSWSRARSAIWSSAPASPSRTAGATS